MLPELDMATKEDPPQRVKNILSSFLVSVDDKETADGCDDHGEAAQLLEHRDREAFNSRVETFTTLKWLAKPTELSPLVCARYGWENTETDMLRCVSCKANLCGQLPRVQNPGIYKECHRKLQVSLVEAHKELCPWRNNPSPVSFLMPSIYSQEETLSDIRSGYAEFTHKTFQLPTISFDTLIQIGLDEDCFRLEILTRPDGSKPVCVTALGEEPINLSAFCLALFGWKRCQQPQVILCERCRRRVGLWSYRPAPSLHNRSPMDSSVSRSPSPGAQVNGHTHSRGEHTDGSPSCKRAKLDHDELRGFDPIEEHKTWCPWVTRPFQQYSTVSQSGALSAGTPEHRTHSPCNSETRLVPHGQALSTSSMETPTHPRSSVKGSRSATISISSDSHTQNSAVCNMSVSTKSPNNSSNEFSQNGQSSSISPTSMSHDLSASHPISAGFSTPSANENTEPPILPAWKMLLVLLSLWKPQNSATTNVKSVTSPPVEGMRYIRRLLRNWTSPRSERRLKLS